MEVGNGRSLGDLTARIFVLLIGLLLVFPALYKLCSYGVFRFHAVAVVGVVEDPLKGRDIGGRPFVDYKDRRGNAYEIRSEAKTHWLYAPKIGDTVVVYYLEKDPQNAIVDSTFHYILFPLLLIGAGAAAVFYCFRRGGSQGGGFSGPGEGSHH